MSRFNTIKFIALIAGLMPAITTFAHVTLEQAQVETGSYYKAVLRVGHGCEGLPTTALRVQIPAGFQGAKPMPKTGWTLQTKLEQIDKPYDNHGTAVTHDITEITWTAASPDAALQDGHYDEFIVRGRAAMPAGAAWFKVTQQCAEGSKTGSNPWTEIPAKDTDIGTSTRGLKYPAALLNVIAPINAASTAAGTPATKPASDPHAGHKH